MGDVVEWARPRREADGWGGFGNLSEVALDVPDVRVILHDMGGMEPTVPGGSYLARYGHVTVPNATATLVKTGDVFTDPHGRVWRLMGAGKRNRLFDTMVFDIESHPEAAT
jgi:hypothetical protein